MNDYQRRVYEDAKLAYVALMKFYPLTLDDLPGEVWLPVPKWEERYQVSNFGRVKSFYKGKQTIVKPQTSRNGYLQTTLYRDGKQKTFRVHRLVAELFILNPENKSTVNHRDGNKLNCYVSNLEWASRTENLQHAVATGLKKSGEKHYRAKFTNEQVCFIRDNPLDLKGYELGEMFDVHPTVISAIQLGKTYRNAGGVVRKSKCCSRLRIAHDQIRAEYVRGCGSTFLAEKYGVTETTILNIVHEN